MGQDGSLGVSASSRRPPSDRHRSPPRHSRESGNPWRNRTKSLAHPPQAAVTAPSSSRRQKRDTNMDSRFRGACPRLDQGNDELSAYPPRADGLMGTGEEKCLKETGGLTIELLRGCLVYVAKKKLGIEQRLSKRKTSRYRRHCKPLLSTVTQRSTRVKQLHYN